MTTIAQRVEWAMRERGLNKNQLEVSARLSAGYLSTMFERNSDNTRAGTLTRLATALGVTPAWLATGVGEPFGAAAAVESPPPPPTSDVHVSRAAAREMVKAAFDKEAHEYDDAIAAEDALLVGAPFVRDLDPTEYVRRLLDTAARYRRKGQTVEGKDLHSATMKAAFEESRELRAQLARQREFEERARIFLRENGIDPDTLEPAKNTTHAPRLAAARPTTPRPKSGSNNK